MSCCNFKASSAYDTFVAESSARSSSWRRPWQSHDKRFCLATEKLMQNQWLWEDIWYLDKDKIKKYTSIINPLKKQTKRREKWNPKNFKKMMLFRTNQLQGLVLGWTEPKADCCINEALHFIHFLWLKAHREPRHECAINIWVPIRIQICSQNHQANQRLWPIDYSQLPSLWYMAKKKELDAGDPKSPKKELVTHRSKAVVVWAQSFYNMRVDR